jgi:hypothetical protein
VRITYDPLYQNALQQAIEWATSLPEEFEGEKAMLTYRSQLETEVGTNIEIEKDDNIVVVAKTEFTERYFRDHLLIKYKKISLQLGEIVFYHTSMPQCRLES